MKLVMAMISSLLVSGAALATPGEIDFSKGCKTNPSLSGPCFKVHGRLTSYNGTPGLRLWPIGSKRLLGVIGADEDESLLPHPIKYADLVDGTSVYGDFEVCPFEDEKPGVMRPVCIESVSNFVVKPTR